jgi:hypothetical protein
MDNTIKMGVVFVLLFVSSSSAFAGNVIYGNLYAKVDQAQGIGLTEKLSQKDAESAIPKGFTQDPRNSPAVHCLLAGEIKSDRCPAAGDRVVVTIPIVSKLSSSTH